ncbi:XkdQ/YqbQ family protein [Brevibacillus borstelensis]|uniref:XkdQ/YqbQ family protein n=1 Tax=Brevibacillus borstelensis TaxID=45462 RepID=UPI0030C60AAD
MYEVLLDDKQGNVWDISGIVTGITWKTSRLGSPGSLDFTLIKGAIYQDISFKVNNGDIVRFRYNDQNVFYGYVFSVDGGKDESVRIKCYDQIRYLLNKDTYVFSKVTASEVVMRIADDFHLMTGQIANTGYAIPTMVEDNQTLLDIIEKALVLTIWNTGRNYILYDEFGSLTLRNVEEMLVDFMIGDNSLMTDFVIKSSIDQDTYNRVKLYKDNKKTGKREVYLAKDSANIAKWGLLQLTQSVDEDKTAAQINALLDQLITIKNRETKTLRIEAIGDPRVRAGCYVPIVIQEYQINQPFLVNEVTHRFDGDDYTMSLELKVIS